jgi:hypothetical protein
VIAGAPAGEVPAGTANTSNDGLVVGAVVHWKAHPIFQPGAVIVKVGLVQLPCSCVGPRSSRAGDGASVDVVDVEEVEECPVVEVEEECLVVDVVEFPVVVVVEDAEEAPSTVVVVAVDPAGGGRT